MNKVFSIGLLFFACLPTYSQDLFVMADFVDMDDQKGIYTYHGHVVIEKDEGDTIRIFSDEMLEDEKRTIYEGNVRIQSESKVCRTSKAWIDDTHSNKNSKTYIYLDQTVCTVREHSIADIN